MQNSAVEVSDVKLYKYCPDVMFVNVLKHGEKKLIRFWKFRLYLNDDRLRLYYTD